MSLPKGRSTEPLPNGLGTEPLPNGRGTESLPRGRGTVFLSSVRTGVAGAKSAVLLSYAAFSSLLLGASAGSACN